MKEYAAKASSLGAVKEVSSKAVAEIKELERERDIVYQERQLQVCSSTAVIVEELEA